MRMNIWEYFLEHDKLVWEHWPIIAILAVVAAIVDYLNKKK